MKKISTLARFRAAFAVLAASTLAITPAAATIKAVPNTATNQVAQVVKSSEMTTYDLAQIRCLAENTYFEAGNQSVTGKIAVNNVVMNRVKNPRFPSTPCAVIKQRNKRTCQFSWVCQRGIRVRNQAVYNASEQVAISAYRGEVTDVTRGSLFYHADYVNPRWNLKRVTKIGAHIFYTYLS
jgi:spore germination cell wall hydrolase CwlJ-like protein